MVFMAFSCGLLFVLFLFFRYLVSDDCAGRSRG
jgi:hypothetical protein